MIDAIRVGGAVLRRERDPIADLHVWAGRMDGLEDVEIVARHFARTGKWSVSFYVCGTGAHVRSALATGWGSTRVEAEAEAVREMRRRFGASEAA